MAEIKLIAFDLDGTLTQHKTKLSLENRQFLTNLSKKYKLLMIGAGQCTRIFEQMEHFPIDIIGNYGMQFGKYNSTTGSLDLIKNESITVCDRQKNDERAALMREKYGFKKFAGDSMEYHPSGCLTFPILGTKAKIDDKLSFDPDRAKRRKIYDEVKALFPEYIVFVGGSSSFDMAPKPYDKYYALNLYCKENNLLHENVLYAGDDYGTGGNDESIFKSDFNFVCVDDYKNVRTTVENALSNIQSHSVRTD